MSEQYTSIELEETADPIYKSVELDDLLNEPEEEYEWILPGLLEYGDRLILTGLEGQGKSTLLRQMAVQLACGIHPFGGDESDFISCDVLVVDMENTRPQVRRALRPLRTAAGSRYRPREFSSTVHYQFRPNGVDLADMAQLSWLTTVCTKVWPSVLIIGPLYKMMAGDPTKEEQAAAVARGIDAIRDLIGCAVIVEAHSPYADGSRAKRPTRPYGASLWSRWPEFGIDLAPDGAIEHWRGPRDEREWPTRLRRGEPWPWMPDGDLHADTEPWNGPANCMKAVKELLDDNPTITYSGNQLISAMRALGHGFRDKTVREAADRLALNDDATVRAAARGSRVYSTAVKQEVLDEDF